MLKIFLTFPLFFFLYKLQKFVTKCLKSDPKCKTGIILERPLNFLEAPSSRKYGPFLCSPLPEGMGGHVAFGAAVDGL